MYAEAAEIAVAIGDKKNILVALGGLGRVAYREERWEEAGTHSRESLRLAQELGMKLSAADEIFWLAAIARATGDTARAARLAAAAAFHFSLLAPSTRPTIPTTGRSSRAWKRPATRKPGSLPRRKAGQ